MTNTKTVLIMHISVHSCLFHTFEPKIKYCKMCVFSSKKKNTFHTLATTMFQLNHMVRIYRIYDIKLVNVTSV